MRNFTLSQIQEDGSRYLSPRLEFAVATAESWTDIMVASKLFGRTVSIEQEERVPARRYSTEWTLADHSTRDISPSDTCSEKWMEREVGAGPTYYGVTYVRSEP